MKEVRKIVKPDYITESIEDLGNMIAKRLEEKGMGTFSSRHEIQGAITEEYHELVDALRGNDVKEFEKELMDIAVGCIFGIACIKAKTIDW